MKQVNFIVPEGEEVFGRHEGWLGICCPKCNREEVSLDCIEGLYGHDAYEAWDGRGDCIKLFFDCEECGEDAFVLELGMHKGTTSIRARAL